MQDRDLNIALISPSKDAYSETFIQAHKENLVGKVFHYFSGELPTDLENGLVINSRKRRFLDLIKGHFNINNFSLAEQALISSFKKNKIDVVFAEFGGTGERILAICKELNLPLLVHFHGYDASKVVEIQRNANYASIFRYAFAILVVSNKMYEDLLKLGCPKDKLKLNIYGPREEFFETEPKFLKQQFIFVGRFVDKKAPYYLILSFLKTLEFFPGATLILAGEGELFNTCKNLVKYYGLEDKVHFPAVITSHQFREFLEESIAYIQHSITALDGDAEGTPVSILEAAAAGLPVISTIHAGIPEVVINNKTGFLVQEHDTDAMAEKMIFLLKNPNLARELGTNAKKYIRENFSIEKHMEIINDLVVLSAKF